MNCIVLKQTIIFIVALGYANNNYTANNDTRICNEPGSSKGNHKITSHLSQMNKTCNEIIGIVEESKPIESNIKTRYQNLNRYIRNLQNSNNLVFQSLKKWYEKIIRAAIKPSINDATENLIIKIGKMVIPFIILLNAEYKILFNTDKSVLNNDNCKCEENRFRCEMHISLKSKCDFMSDLCLKIRNSSKRYYTIINSIVEKFKNEANNTDLEIKEFYEFWVENLQYALNIHSIYQNRGIIPYLDSRIPLYE